MTVNPLCRHSMVYSKRRRRAMNINKNALKRIILKIHRLGIKFGIHIFPTHYYTSVPNILELERTLDICAKKSELPGVSVNLDEQVNNLRNICMPYQSE